MALSTAVRQSNTRPPQPEEPSLMSREEFAKRAGMVFLPGDKREMVLSEMPLSPGDLTGLLRMVMKVSKLTPAGFANRLGRGGLRNTFGKMEKRTDADDFAFIGSGEQKVPNRIKDGLSDGRVVRDEIPNQNSIEASFAHPEILPGLRDVPMSLFKARPFIAADDLRRVRSLSQEIKQSREINPLIVGVDEKGPFILEGGHRFEALHLLGAKSFPAQIVFDEAGSFTTKLP
jgi:hypothetical protein